MKPLFFALFAYVSSSLWIFQAQAQVDGAIIAIDQQMVAGEERVYRFSSDVAANTTLFLSGSTTLSGELRDGNGSLVAIGSEVFNHERLLLEGEYFIQLRNSGSATENFSITMDTSLAALQTGLAISNLVALNRSGTKLVEITYDLDAPGFGSAAVTLQASSDGGSTWTVPVTSARGAVGAGVTPGIGKSIVWDAGVDWPQSYSTQMRFRLLADHGFSYIPGGSFTMGRTSGDADSNAPSTIVTVGSFYLAEKETTKAQWDEVATWAASNGYTDLAAGAGKAASHPVHSVTWWDVVKWCNARSEKELLTPVYTVGGAVMRTGTTVPEVNWRANGYRLPTEAEWEKAARGAVSGTRFSWGTDTISHAQANYRVSSSNGTSNLYAYDVEPRPPANGADYYHPGYAVGGTPYTAPVGSFPANAFGLHDMTGNVWEWCWDWYGGNYYATSSVISDPRGPVSGSSRVVRGGGWLSSALDARCTSRAVSNPDNTEFSFGFRPARSVILEGMVDIPSGKFIMGRTKGDVDTDAPSITVNVSHFYLQQVETTKSEWDAVRTWALGNGYTDLVEGGGKASDHPVQRVSWWDVVKWCNARSEMEGLMPVYTVDGVVMRTGTTEPEANWRANGYRLPTEAEWEKAARGAGTCKRYPWGTDTISHTQANYYGNPSYSYDLSPVGDHPSYDNGIWPYTSPVGSFLANGLGLYDMAGNVREWCWDRYGASYYQTSDGKTNPLGPVSGADRVIRGGGFASLNGAFDARCGSRDKNRPDSDDDADRGFRPARSSLENSILQTAVGALDTRDAPAVTLPTASLITIADATLGGTVTSDGGAAITERGVVYSPTATNADPLIEGPGVTKVTATGTTGAFTAPVTGLTQGTHYNFKVYAINSKGTTYGSISAFTTLSNNANLSGLTLEGFVFSPAFVASTARYSANAQRADETVRLRPISADPGATISARINGGGWVTVVSGSPSLPLTLAFGNNLVEMRVIAQDGSTQQIYSMDVFRLKPQPDALVGSSLAQMRGGNIFTGALAQKLEVTSQRAAPVTAFVSVINRGNRPDRFDFRGGDDSRFFKVEYRDANSTLVSAAVKAGLYRTDQMDPDAPAESLQVSVTPVKKLIVEKDGKKTVTLRKIRDVIVNATSVLDPTITDGVSIEVETR
jgi:sulfatase modifying factor 1